MADSTTTCPDGHANPLGQHFCGQCGLALDTICVNGHSNPAGQKFCGDCGAPLSDQVETESAAGAAHATSASEGVTSEDIEPADEPATVPDHGGARVGATFTTGTGEQATVRAITGNDVWVDVQDASAAHIGTFRFPLTAVETALANQDSMHPPTPAAKYEPPHIPDATPTLAAAAAPKPDEPRRVWSSTPTPPQAPQAGGFDSRAEQQDGGVAGWWRGLTTNGKRTVMGGAAALVLLLVLLFNVGGQGGSPSRPAAGGGSGTSSGAATSTVDDWVASVCQVGTYSSSGGGLRNADASGFCMSPSNMPIMIGQYSSDFGAQSDAAMVPGARYAMLRQANGDLCMFLAVSAGSGNILSPLSQFGAKFGSS